MAVTLGTNAGFVTVAPVADPADTDSVIDNIAKALKDISPAGSSLVITEVGWYCDNATEAADYTIGLYSDAGAGEPETRLQITSATPKGTTAGWKTISGLSWSISAETAYWLALGLANTATATNMNTATAGNYGRAYIYTSTLPADWGTSEGTLGTGTYSIYALVEGSSPSASISASPSEGTPSPSPSLSPSQSISASPSEGTPSPSPSHSISASVSHSPSASVSQSISASPSEGTPSPSPSHSISASISASPSASASASAESTASTIIMMPFVPEARIRETLAWRTETLRGGDDTEQRIALRAVPRQTITLTHILRGDSELAQAEIYLQAYGQSLWYLPYWHERTRLIGTLAAGATTVTLNTASAAYYANGSALIWQAGSWEVVEIASVTAGALTLASGLENDYSGALCVMPCVTAYLTASPSWTRWPTGNALLTMEYTAIDNQTPYDYEPDSSYDGLEVLTDPSYLLSDYHAELDPRLEIIDSGLGRIAGRAIGAMISTSQPLGLVATSSAVAWRIRQWLHTLYGGQRTFFAPTFRRDFEAVAPIGAADDTIDVTSRGLASLLGVNDLRAYIGIRYGSSLVPRRITGVTTLSATTERLTLDAAVGVDCPASAATLICWMDRLRLDSDVVNIDWTFPGRCTVDMRVRRLPVTGVYS